MSGAKVAIIGGAGAMGRWFARFFIANGYEVIIRDVDDNADEVARSLGAEYAANNIAAVRDADITIISVPINVTEAVISEVAPHLRRGSLLSDLTSVKRMPMNAMDSYAPDGVEVVGMHPILGPTVETMQGQVIIMTPRKEMGKWSTSVKELFERHGAGVEITTPEEHDRIMTVVQGLTHFTHIAVASTLRELDFDIRKSRRFMSPVYEIMMDLVGRILAQDPHLYATIQLNQNDENIIDGDIIDIFISQCKHLYKLIEDDDLEGLVKEIKASAEHFKDAELALKESDKLIGYKAGLKIKDF